MGTSSSAVLETGSSVKWLPTDKDYTVALIDGKLQCRNPKGKQLASIPKWLKDSDLGQELLAVRDWLKEHQQECQSKAELWMLRSLPVPRKVLASVWADPTWRNLLINTVVVPTTKAGAKQKSIDQTAAGFLKDVDAKKGVGIVDADGETQWLKSDTIAIPHPILLDDLDDFRELAVELQFEQSLDQLFRQTWSPTDQQQSGTSIKDFGNGKFEMLTHALSLCRRLGYKVSGGYACCPVWESGKLLEARYWIGAEYPESETYTDELMFTNESDTAVQLSDVGPVTFSEGMKMAAAIYAKRVVKDEEEN